jgi:hypothetical protein
MFKLDLSPTFWAPVKYQAPKEDGTGMAFFTFDVQFPRLSEPELGDMLAKAKPAPDAPKADSFDTRVARLMVRGWRGVADPAGEEIAFSQAALDRLLALDGMGSAIVAAFERVRPGAARGN